MKISELYDLEHTIASGLFTGLTYPWEALGKISNYILELGAKLDPEKFDHPQEGVWIAKDAHVYPSAYLGAPCIVDSGAEVRHCAFVRGSAIIGKNAVVGNSTELKNVVLFDGVQVPHYNYVGDSILGYMAHMGAGSITSNVRSDKANVIIHTDTRVETGRKKVGAMLGDHVEVGCNAVLCPGAVVGRNSQIYPLSLVRGVIPADSIVTNTGRITALR